MSRMEHGRGAAAALALALACAAVLPGCGSGTEDPPATYTVGGTVSGLMAGNKIVLTNNGSDNVEVTADGAFTFATEVEDGQDFRVTLAGSTPTAQPCTSTYGSGTIDGAKVRNVTVICGLPGGTGTSTATGSLNFARRQHTATRLPNGKVLIAGGFNEANTAMPAELYDPESGTFSITGTPATQRFGHAATLLPNGRVLVVGGSNSLTGQFDQLADAELYDPATGQWSSAGALALPRYLPTATLLPDGRVLVAGGLLGSRGRKEAELFDPATVTWQATGSLKYGRWAHTAMLLTSGKVQACDGAEGALDDPPWLLCEMYDPRAGTWADSGAEHVQRAQHTMNLLPDGKVVAAGWDIRTELYDPASDSWSESGQVVVGGEHTATLLPSGKVLVAGGLDQVGVANATYLFDPVAVTWTDGNPMLARRVQHTATLLTNGKLLIVGGWSINGAVASAELYF